MKRFILASLVLAGLLAIPAVASAEPQYVWVRYGTNHAPYLLVTTEPNPFPELPVRYVSYEPRAVTVPLPGTYYQRADGVRFDSDVGAACSLLSTEVYFGPLDAMLDQHDRFTLANMSQCLTRGALTGVQITLVAGYDGTEGSSLLATSRLGQVIDYLGALGVKKSQLTYQRELVPSWQTDRVRFRIRTPPAPYVYELR